MDIIYGVIRGRMQRKETRNVNESERSLFMEIRTSKSGLGSCYQEMFYKLFPEYLFLKNNIL